MSRNPWCLFTRNVWVEQEEKSAQLRRLQHAWESLWPQGQRSHRCPSGHFCYWSSVTEIYSVRLEHCRSRTAILYQVMTAWHGHGHPYFWCHYKYVSHLEQMSQTQECWARIKPKTLSRNSHQHKHWFTERIMRQKKKKEIDFAIQSTVFMIRKLSVYPLLSLKHKPL